MYMSLTVPDREWKKGSAELLVLSLLEDQPRHGYDISKLIRIRSGGALHDLTLSAAPSAGEGRLARGTMGGEAPAAPAAILQSDSAGQESASVQAEELEGFRRRRQPSDRSRACLVAPVTSWDGRWN